MSVMQSGNPPSNARWKRAIVPSVIVLAFAGAIMFSNTQTEVAPGVPLITTVEEYSKAITKAEELTKEPLQKLSAGETLSDEDKKALDEGKNYFLALSKSNPLQVTPFFALGRIFEALDQPEDAARNYEQAILNESKDPVRDSEALKKTVVEAKGSLSMTLQKMAQMANQSKDEVELAKVPLYYDRAYRWADQAVTAIPNSVKYLTARAGAALQLKKVDVAKKDVISALELDPTDDTARGLATLLGIKTE